MVLLFFSEYKITHQQASFECFDSVFTHCLLACCLKITTIEQLLECWKIRKSFFAIYLAKPTWCIKLHLELVSSHIQELDRYKKLYELLDWRN